MLQARPPADCVLLKGPLDKSRETRCRWLSYLANQVCRDKLLLPKGTAKSQMGLRICMRSCAAKLRLARHRRVCRLCHCSTGALRNERYMLLVCLASPAHAVERFSARHKLFICHGLLWANHQPMVNRYSISWHALLKCYADDEHTLCSPCSA